MQKRKQDKDGIYQRGDSPYWWASYTDGSGKQTRRSTGVRIADDPRKTEAKRVRAQWIAQPKRVTEKSSVAQTGPTFDDLMLAYLEGPGAKLRAKDRLEHAIKALFPHFTGRSLASLTRADYRTYIDAREALGKSAATINRELIVIRAAINWANKELEWSAPNPFRGGLTEPEARDRWLTEAEAERLLFYAAEVNHLYDFCALALNTGMRKNEILGLEWSRVDLHNGLLYLGASDQKNGKVGSVPLNESARQAILSRARFRASFCPASPWVFAKEDGERLKYIRRSFDTACRKAGLKDVHPHDLRRTFGSRLVQAGVSIQAVSGLLRHSDIRLTERIYAHLSPDNLREAVSTLDPDKPTTKLRSVK